MKLEIMDEEAQRKYVPLMADLALKLVGSKPGQLDLSAQEAIAVLVGVIGIMFMAAPPGGREFILAMQRRSVEDLAANLETDDGRAEALRVITEGWQ